jgi:hypothetical protein
MATYTAISSHASLPMDEPPRLNSALNSWKEIAVYLGRGVRTVQRWERELGLPVHRIRESDHSPVFAFANELQIWLEHRSNAGVPSAPSPRREPLQPLPSDVLTDVVSRSQLLTTKMRELLLEQTRTTERLRHNLRNTMAALNRDREKNHGFALSQPQPTAEFTE